MVVEASLVELFAGAGGLSGGLATAGFRKQSLLEIDGDSVSTLRSNLQTAEIFHVDILDFDPLQLEVPTLLAAGVPSVAAGPSNGSLRLVDIAEYSRVIDYIRLLRPKAVLLENVGAFGLPRFKPVRGDLIACLDALGYDSTWRVLRCFEYGVPQLRPRFLLVALHREHYLSYKWPLGEGVHVTVGAAIGDLMAANGWRGAKRWAAGADDVAPTIIGGSRLRGGADLGPSRARAAWLALGVDGRSIADRAPSFSEPFTLTPKLTNRMVARLQGFCDEWKFVGAKTSTYRQIASALPPVMGRVMGQSILAALV